MSEDKKYDPTPHRLEQARQQGQAPKSADLLTSASLGAGLLTLLAMRDGLLNACCSVSQWGSKHLVEAEHTPIESMMPDLLTAALPVLWRTGVVVCVSIGTAVALGLFQTQGMVSAAPLTPKFESISPAGGFKRIFSKQHAWDVAKILFKSLLILWVGTSYLRGRLAEMQTLPWMDGMDSGAWLGAAVHGLVVRLLLLTGLIALLDFGWQQYSYKKNLMMTRQEVIEDMKMQEGDPYIKARRRQLQRQMSRRASVNTTRDARVVVTNPTHYAVALAYDDGETEVPRVLVKGENHRAFAIVSRARAFGVRVLESPPLARALHAAVDEGDHIPPHMYLATAQVLVMVARMEEREKARQPKGEDRK